MKLRVLDVELREAPEGVGVTRGQADVQYLGSRIAGYRPTESGAVGNDL